MNVPGQATAGDSPREPPRPPRYLCIVCFKSLSTSPGTCRACDAPKLDLAEPAVAAEVRAEAERRLQKRKYREEAPLFAISLIGGMAFAVSIGFPWLLGLLLAYPIQKGLVRTYTRLRPGSAIATYAARRLRISAELGVDVQVPTVPLRRGTAGLTADASDQELAAGAAEDPDTLDLMHLLDWLGAKVEH